MGDDLELTPVVLTTYLSVWMGRRSAGLVALLLANLISKEEDLKFSLSDPGQTLDSHVESGMGLSARMDEPMNHNGFVS
ncbi:hypothetical protein MTR_1g019265 [Medicago truncatula]|uniref:Uncharacterized protein n=1 Tax=Medicago truncatula TaxID=3880 RepID=A0A072VEJ8_MEDTR|nr:hypothetical protein MTR_1g019265 [Medicago truncatula]